PQPKFFAKGSLQQIGRQGHQDRPTFQFSSFVPDGSHDVQRRFFQETFRSACPGETQDVAQLAFRGLGQLFGPKPPRIGDGTHVFVEATDGNDVSFVSQVISQTSEPHALPQLLEQVGMITYLDNSWLIDPRHTYILEDLRVRLSLARLLDDTFGLSRQQGPEDMGLGLLLCVWTEGKVDVSVCQIGMTSLVGDPDLVKHRIVGDLLQYPFDLLRAESSRFPNGHEMRGDAAAT